MLGIDFHSTHEGLFYKSNYGIQHVESVLNNYLSKLNLLDDKVKAPIYPSANRGTSLDFINSVLGCSAVTREFGYGDTDQMIEFRSRNEARILMKFLLNI